MSSRSQWQSLAILCCALPFGAAAQTANSIPNLENIVVTPGRTAQLESEVIGDVTVIDKKELERAGQSSVAEVLARQPGIQFSNTGGPQTQTSVFLRGTNPLHTLVLVNGMRVNSASSGAINWNAIDTAAIERIEVVRGAASSLYGADALGGVVNIITKKGGDDRPLSAWGNIGYGTHDTFKSSAGISGAQNGWDYSFFGSVADSQGFNATNQSNLWGEYNEDRDGYTEHAFGGSLGYRWAPDQHIGITAYNAYIHGDFDAGPGDPAIALTRQQAYTIASTNKLTERWESVLSFGLSKELGHSRSYGSESVFGTLQRQYSWQNNFSLNDHNKLTLLVERLEERPVHSSGISVNRRNTNSIGGIYRADYGRHHLQASVRNDAITSQQKKTTGGLGYDFDLTEQWTIGMAANTGFRMATFADMYGPSFPSSFGFPGYATNPDLKPEKSKNLEVSARYTDDDTQFSITAYQNKITDLINGSTCFDFDASGMCLATRPENIDKARIRGLTLAGSHQIGNTTLHGSADFMDARNTGNKNWLPRRAKQVYNLGISRRIDAWDLGAEYQFVGKRYDDAANTTRLGGYSLVNLTAAYDFTKNVGVQVRWNNVFDKNYTTVYGYNTPGSNVFVNLSFRM